MIAAIVDTTTLGKVILYSLVAGVGIAVIFGLGVSSAGGLLEAVRDRRKVAGVLWGLLMFVCGAAVLGALVLGLVVMSSKS